MRTRETAPNWKAAQLAGDYPTTIVLQREGFVTGSGGFSFSRRVSSHP